MTYYALADCNNFYASCERIFQPHLKGKPIVVLSNNDGCVIARSNESKALGIKMGVPYWEIKDIIKKHNIFVFSSNYQLYGDISERVMNIMQEACGDVEVYSIDEAFLLFDDQFISLENIEKTCKHLRSKILQCTSILVSIGLGTTKTLAKLANRIAKKRLDTEGVFTLNESEKTQEVLAQIHAQDVWGVGRAYSRELDKYGIKTALDLKNANQTWIKKKFGVVLLRTVKELNGIPCFALEPPIESRQNIMVSRSFRKDVYVYSELSEALSVYATRLGEKLRHYQQTTSILTVFLWTNPHRRLTTDSRIYFTASVELPFSTSNTNDLIKYALKLLKDLYKSDHNYKKAGILAGNLRPDSCTQGNLFEPFDTHLKNKKLMTVMDDLNRRYGKQTLYMASCGESEKHTWARQEQFRSKRFTTQWGDILVIR